MAGPPKGPSDPPPVSEVPRARTDEPAAKANAKGKAKAPAKGQAAEVQFDEAELEVSDFPENNYLLGDAIE